MMRKNFSDAFCAPLFGKANLKPLWICLPLLCSQVAQAGIPDKKADALRLIEEAVPVFCQRAPLSSNQVGGSLSVGASAKLAGITKKIADLGFSGAAGVLANHSTGVVQAQLAGAIKDGNACAISVLTILKPTLMGPPTGPSGSYRRLRSRAGASKSLTASQARNIPPSEMPRTSPVLSDSPKPSAPTGVRMDPSGTWDGKWDGIYKVKFLISHYGSEDEYRVIYQHEEIPGRPMKSREVMGNLRGDALFLDDNVITITFSGDTVIAYGRFQKTRIAYLNKDNRFERN
jgi:hypothetical protein